jgi:hypothetical protein
MFYFCSYIIFLSWLIKKAKTPRLTGNRGVFENCLVKSKVRSRDARIAINTHPNGRMSFGLHGIQFGCKCGLHVRRAL